VTEVSFTPSLTREQVEQLTHAAGALHDEAERCAQAECWRASLVLIGSALEAAITATACCFEPELREAGIWPRRDPTGWTFGIAVSVAKKAGWLKVRGTADDGLLDGLAGDTGDAIRFVNGIRNMATHPGAAIRSTEPRPNFDDVEHMKPTYEVAVGVAAAVFDELNRALVAADDRP
jgi:hypothetical protein